jgi:sialic acid synthase SpsE
MQLGRLNSSWLGLSSHCRDPLVAPLAVAYGAKMIEYHFHLSWKPSRLESNVSLNEHEFRAMVESVRRVEEML